MSLTPSGLHDKIAALALIDGISFSDLSDKSTWTVQYQTTATDAQKTAAQAVIDAATIPLVMSHRQWTPYEFYQKFTADERKALKASTDATVDEFRTDISLYQIVYPDSDEMATAMAYLVNIGIITDARKIEILK